MWASCLAQFLPAMWQNARRICSVLWLPSLVALPCMILLQPAPRYVYGYSVVAVLFLIILIHLVDRPSVVPEGLSSGLARCSYSLYLTHGLMISLALHIVSATPSIADAMHLGIMLLLVGVAGVLFYYSVEFTALAIRERLVPRRALSSPHP